jgi:hypothetical protein
MFEPAFLNFFGLKGFRRFVFSALTLFLQFGHGYTRIFT